MLPGSLKREPGVKIVFSTPIFNNHERGLGPGEGGTPLYKA